MYHKRKRIFLWIIIGIGTASFISCGRGAGPDRESAGSGAAAEAASGAGETDGVEGSMAEGGTAKNGTADTGTDRGAGSGTAKTEADTVSPEGLPDGTDEKPEQKEAVTGGKGIRKERSSEFSDMEANWESGEGWDSEKYDLEYELPLDEPLTLAQAGKRWWLAKDRVTDWEVASVTCAAGVELSEEQVERPEEAYLEYCDEDCALYSFSNAESGLSYLAMYRWEDRTLSVLAQEENAINQPELYKGKIYYATDIVEPVRYKPAQAGEEQRAEEEDTVGVRLNRIAPEGTGKETIFTYRYPEEDQEIRENQIPYLALIYEISGDEIAAEVYIGDKPHPFASGSCNLQTAPYASRRRGALSSSIE